MYDDMFSEVTSAAFEDELEKIAFALEGAAGGLYGYKNARKKDKIEGALLGAGGAIAGGYTGALAGALALGIPTLGLGAIPGAIAGNVYGGMKGAKWATEDIRRAKRKHDKKKKMKGKEKIGFLVPTGGALYGYAKAKRKHKGEGTALGAVGALGGSVIGGNAAALLALPPAVAMGLAAKDPKVGQALARLGILGAAGAGSIAGGVIGARKAVRLMDKKHRRS